MYRNDVPQQRFEFDTRQFDFYDIIQKHLHESTGAVKPEWLHHYLPKDKMPTDPVEGTAHTYGHDILYAVDPAFRQANIVPARDRGFVRLYQDFMRHLQETIFTFPLVYQTTPSLRLHYPGFTSYGVMHTDREYNHPSQEINLWMPITATRDTASMVIESAIGKGDYAPVNMAFGGLFVFDSALMHGNLVNEEGYTRVSMDMRIIPLARYKDAAGSFSATAGKEFKIGGYYSLLDGDQAA